MIGWFRPTCPCDAEAKAWIERRLEWLSAEFDESEFTGRPVVLPTREFFPDRYDASRNAVRSLLDRVCEYMGVEPATVALELFSNSQNPYLVDGGGHELPVAAGTY